MAVKQLLPFDFNRSGRDHISKTNIHLHGNHRTGKLCADGYTHLFISLIFTERRNRGGFPDKTVLRITRISQQSSENMFQMFRRMVPRSKQIHVPGLAVLLPSRD